MKQQPKNRRKRVLRWVLGIILILFYWIISCTPVNLFLPHCSPYVFCADNNGFCDNELWKGRDPFGSVMIRFESYKNKVQKPDLQLYRCFKRKWWQVWNWPDFLVHPRWDVPYNPACDDGIY